jgi:hypothetical protein
MLDLTGQRYGRLTVLNFGSTRWRCLCDCGEVTYVVTSSLRRGMTKSCGCLLREYLAYGVNRIHGHTSRSKTGKVSKTWTAWQNMIQRCTNLNYSRYDDWGGRGIKVCERWLEENGFINFLADMGECPPGMSLERIENNKGYEPGNCKWATLKEQNNNTRRKRIENFTTAELEAELKRRKLNIDHQHPVYLLGLAA